MKCPQCSTPINVPDGLKENFKKYGNNIPIFCGSCGYFGTRDQDFKIVRNLKDKMPLDRPAFLRGFIEASFGYKQGISKRLGMLWKTISKNVPESKERSEFDTLLRMFTKDAN